MRFVFAGLLAITALSLASRSAQAQCFTCMAVGQRFHAHGPLYSYANYGQPGTGYGYGAGYGNCGSTGCFPNRAPMSCGRIGNGFFNGGLLNGGLLHHNNSCNSCGSSGGYALSTLKNVWSRISPFHARSHCSSGCGSSCSGGCSGGCR